MKKLASFVLALTLTLSACAFAEEDKDFSAIRINELMASCGKKTLALADGSTPDWIELYNTSDQDIDLKGLCLSDGKKKLEKFVFPEVVLPAHSYLIVYCTGEEAVTAEGIFVPFKLSAKGEKAVLSYKGSIIDIVEYEELDQKNVSYALDTDGIWKKTSYGTPGTENVIVEPEIKQAESN